MSSDNSILEIVEAAFIDVAKPEHFTNYLHCEECEEHDQTLLLHDRETLTVAQVNNQGWDPICFCTPRGKAYYMPSLVRFALAESTEKVSPYWQQLLFHLEGDGSNNALIAHCTGPQREAIAAFLQHLVETRASEVERHHSTDELLRVHGYWLNAA